MLSIHTGQPASTAPKLPIFAALAQGFFCIVIGLWAVVDFSAFVNVTAQKPDQWLVTLAGLLLASIGASMIISAFRRDIAFEVFFIGLAAALSLAATDIFFVIKGVLPLRFLLDAVAELLFVTLWIFAIRACWPTRPPRAETAPPAVEKIAEPRGTDAAG